MPLPFRRNQWTDMPSCESVKAMNAPTANSGISRSVIPLNTVSSNPAVAANHSMPTE
jgi:hypothetical protein